MSLCKHLWDVVFHKLILYCFLKLRDLANVCGAPYIHCYCKSCSYGDDVVVVVVVVSRRGDTMTMSILRMSTGLSHVKVAMHHLTSLTSPVASLCPHHSNEALAWEVSHKLLYQPATEHLPPQSLV